MKNNKKRNIIIGIVSTVFVILILLIIAGVKKSENNSSSLTNANTSDKSNAGDLVISKSDVTSAKFYQYNIDNTKMEVIALKASDGTIRTAFNTCQVCYSSGRGYYKVNGNTLVCQNCGNVFRFDQVEKERGGCNPVPILSKDKSDDGSNITISKEYLQQAKKIFANWKN